MIQNLLIPAYNAQPAEASYNLDELDSFEY